MTIRVAQVFEKSTELLSGIKRKVELRNCGIQNPLKFLLSRLFHLFNSIHNTVIDHKQPQDEVTLPRLTNKPHKTMDFLNSQTKHHDNEH